MTALPPGRYAVVLADAAGAPLAGQMGLVLAWDGAATAWKLAGLTVRPGVFDGHDGVWYWQRARELAKTDPWSAWFSYDAARYLLLPVDFLSSPNLQKAAPGTVADRALARERSFRCRCPTATAHGRSKRLDSTPRCTRPIWAWRTSRRASPIRRRCALKRPR